VPLLVALSGWGGRDGHLPGVPARRAFGLGLLTGVVAFVGTLYWTSTVLSGFGGVPAPVAAVAMLLLALYLALYPALAAVVIARCVAAHGAAGLWVAPAAWVATEWARGVLFGGFPWVPLGNSQVTLLPVAQLASVTGVYGLSALVAGVAAGVAVALVGPARQRARVLAATVGVLAVVIGWGLARLADGTLARDGEPLRVGLVQANIAQDDKWRPTEARRIFTTHVALTRDVVARGAEYVLWPESSTPFMFEEDAEGGAAVRALARETGVPLLLGSEQYVRAPEPRLYNAAFQLAPDGATAAVYRKNHLVPFGEYLPFREWLFFASPLVERMVEFSPGTSVEVLPLGDGRVSTAICYEVVYPGLVRQAVLNGSQLLTTITNDGWYGESSAPYQHFAMASMRAIEQGRWLARAANTGISGVVDPYGRVTAASGIFEEAGLVAEVRLRTARTTYARAGDVVVWAALAVTALALVSTRRRGQPPGGRQ
jgi:apolipoprotein N-acyltransferase